MNTADTAAVLAGTKQPQRYSGNGADSVIGDVEVSGIRSSAGFRRKCSDRLGREECDLDGDEGNK